MEILQGLVWHLCGHRFDVGINEKAVLHISNSFVLSRIAFAYRIPSFYLVYTAEERLQMALTEPIRADVTVANNKIESSIYCRLS